MRGGRGQYSPLETAAVLGPGTLAARSSPAPVANWGDEGVIGSSHLYWSRQGEGVGGRSRGGFVIRIPRPPVRAIVSSSRPAPLRPEAPSGVRTRGGAMTAPVATRPWARCGWRLSAIDAVPPLGASTSKTQSAGPWDTIATYSPARGVRKSAHGQSYRALQSSPYYPSG